MAKRKVKQEKELIEAATIARFTDKSGKLLGFRVKSNTSEKYHDIQVFMVDEEIDYFCDCEAHQYGCVECRYIKAVKEVEAARENLPGECEQAALAILEAERAEAAVVEAMFQAAQKALQPVGFSGPAPFAPPALAPLNGRGFRVESIPELNGARVPMK